MAKKKVIISPNDINPVDFYNQNCVQDCYNRLTKLKSVKAVDNESLTYITNKGDENKRMIVVEDGYFVAKLKNGFHLQIGTKMTPFMMLQKFIRKNDFSSSLSYVIKDCMHNHSNYVRVGTKYWQVIKQKDRYGITRNVLELWDKQTIVDDHGRDFLASIEKYKSFTIEPNNKEYTRYVDNFNYNLYAPFEHKPCSENDYSGDLSWHWTNTLLKHIFGDQLTLAYIYIKALYEIPEQALPILVLTSKERQTGKSTLLNYLNILFGANTILINPQDISNPFNGAYANKNIIMIEESRFDSVQALEKLKNLATQNVITVNSKFVNHYQIPFYGKLIITSNDEQKFSKVDWEEIRYWVLQIPTLEGKIKNHQILDNLRDEIPYFLYFLENLHKFKGDWMRFLRPDGTINLTRSRQVFTAEDLMTTGLQTVKDESRPELYKEIEMYLENHCMQNANIETLLFTSIDVKNKFFANNHQIKATYINKVIKVFFEFEKDKKTKRYVPLDDNAVLKEYVYGKPYTYKNPFYDTNVKPEIDETEPDIPF